MAAPPAPFITATDSKDLPYILANGAVLDEEPYGRFLPSSAKAADPYYALRPPSARGTTPDLCTFLDDELVVSSRAAGRFSSDLTSEDDVILAALALLLILVVQSLIATVLLRRQGSGFSPGGVAIKHVLDLVRDFRPIQVLKSHPRPSACCTSARLAATVAALLLALLALETLVLVFTSPGHRDVTNDVASFRMLPVVDPDWDVVRARAEDRFDRPCRDIRLPGVDTGLGRVTACLTSSILQASFDKFETVTDTVNVTISSYVHEFGIEHLVTIGDETAAYSARADFRLGDGLSRLLPQRTRYFDKALQLAFIHKQYVAFLFNSYQRETRDTSMDMARLNAIDFLFQVEEEPDSLIDVIQLNAASFGQFRQVRSTKHTTELKDVVVPRGTAALRFAQLFFAASIGIVVSGPDQNDLQLGTGNTIAMPSVLWQEDARVLNWLSLTIILLSTLLLLTILRAMSHPTGTAEIAAQVVGVAVGAPCGVSPIFWDGHELKYFNLSDSEYGEDTSDEEYNIPRKRHSFEEKRTEAQ